MCRSVSPLIPVAYRTLSSLSGSDVSTVRCRDGKAKYVSHPSWTGDNLSQSSNRQMRPS
jgi:hypothetical protein